MSSAPTALTNEPPAAAAPQDWRTGLPEELRADKSFEKFKGVPDLAKSYVEIQKSMGNAIRMPKADAPQEEYDKFYERLGRPESPDKYELKRPESPAGGAWDENFEKQFKIAAHANGLVPRQVQGFVDWYNKAQSESLANYAKSIEEGVGKLKTEWGGKFDERLGLASRVVKEVGGDSLRDLLNNGDPKSGIPPGLGNHPVLIRLFATLGEQMAEDTLITGEGGHEDTGKEAIQLKIDAIRRDPKHAFNDIKASPVAREAALREMAGLYKQLYPEAD